MRKNQSSVIIRVIFGILALVMIGFGVRYSSFKGSTETDAVAEVNSETIYQQQLQRSVHQMVETYRNLYKDAFSTEMLKALKFKDQALDDLIRVALLRQQAEKLGLTVTNDEVRDAVALVPAFQQNGRFNFDQYDRVLRANGMKPGDFEDAQREDLLVRKLQELLLSGVYVSDAELKQQFDYENEQVSLRFVRVSSAALESQIQVSDEQLQAFYDANKERFRQPPRVRAELVTYSPSAFADKVTVDDDEVQSYFQDHSSEYEGKQLDDVRGEIQVTLRGNKALLEARHAAEADHDKVRDGQDLAAVAQASGAPLSNIGPLTQADPIPGAGRVPELARALFNAEAGQVGEPVETDSNAYVFQVVEKIPSQIPELKDIHDEVLAAGRSDLAEKKAKDQASAMLTKLQAGEDLAAVAAAQNLSVEETDSFRRLDTVIPGLGSQADLRTDAFALTPAKPLAPQVYDVDGDAVVAVLKEKLPADESHFGDQKESLRTQMEDRRKHMVMDEYIKDLKQRSLIRINPGAVDRVLLS